MITSKQRAYLRGLANPIDSIFQVGKGGINDNMIVQFNEALEKRELVKATVLQNCDEDPREIAHEIGRLCEAEVVQCIGKKFVLYKESKNNKTIDLKKIK